VPEINGKYAQDDDEDERASNFRVDGDLDPKPTDSKNIYYDELSKLKKDDQDAVLGVALGKGFRKMLRDGGTPAEFAKLTINEKYNKAYTLDQLKKGDDVLARILKEQAK